MPVKSKEKPFPVIRYELFKRDMNYGDLAKMVGLSTPAISKRMAKRVPWKLTELVIMSKKWNKSIDELVS